MKKYESAFQSGQAHGEAFSLRRFYWEKRDEEDLKQMTTKMVEAFGLVSEEAHQFAAGMQEGYRRKDIIEDKDLSLWSSHKTQKERL
jgi:hypothetical protein